MDPALTAYEQLIGPMEDRMIRIVWRLTRERQDAEDALQDALLTIWKRWECVAGHPAPTAFVLKVCVDSALDVLRRRRRWDSRSGPLEAVFEPVDGAPDAERQAIERELSQEVLMAMRALPRQQAVASALRIFEELSYAEIAGAMGCSEATARKHAERGRTRLQVALAHHAPFKPSAGVCDEPSR